MASAKKPKTSASSSFAFTASKSKFSKQVTPTKQQLDTDADIDMADPVGDDIFGTMEPGPGPEPEFPKKSEKKKRKMAPAAPPPPPQPVVSTEEPPLLLAMEHKLSNPASFITISDEVKKKHKLDTRSIKYASQIREHLKKHTADWDAWDASQSGGGGGGGAAKTKDSKKKPPKKPSTPREVLQFNEPSASVRLVMLYLNYHAEVPEGVLPENTTTKELSDQVKDKFDLQFVTNNPLFPKDRVMPTLTNLAVVANAFGAETLMRLCRKAVVVQIAKSGASPAEMMKVKKSSKEEMSLQSAKFVDYFSDRLRVPYDKAS